LHWIISSDPTSEKDIARLFDAAAGRGSDPGKLWRYTSPYRGLEAMEEKDSDYFFGRTTATVDVLSALAAAPDRLPALVGNSGVGKSSLARAGVLAALKRQAWPVEANATKAWPAAFENSRQWCFLSFKPGPNPLKALVESFLDTWEFAAIDPDRASRLHDWVELLHAKAMLSDLIDATERRRKELDRPKPPAFFLYVDQGEELYAQSEELQRRRFSELLAQALPDPRLRAMMSLRADFLGALQSDKPLFKARYHIDVPPLGEEELREVVGRPVKLLGAEFETDRLIEIITKRTAEDSIKDVGALPLLSYTLDEMWRQMVERGDEKMRLPSQSFELSGVLVDHGDKFLAAHPDAEETVRRVLTLKLATVRDDGQPTRRRAARAEFSDEEWRLVSELSAYPNRLLVVAATDAGDAYAQVAHEAVFKRWGKLSNWIASEREFLAWRSGLEAARRTWQEMPAKSRNEALLMGAALTKAKSWHTRRAEDLPALDREFIALSIAREKKAQARARNIRALVYVLLVGIIAGLAAWEFQPFIVKQWSWYTVSLPYKKAHFSNYALPLAKEHGLKPGEPIHECDENCPQMIVLPARTFQMGSPDTDTDAAASEKHLHAVTIAKMFAVSKTEVTFSEWNSCIAGGGCIHYQHKFNEKSPPGNLPAVWVSWDDAQDYVQWLSEMTGHTYRLLTEAEYEYAARAGTTTRYPWGDDIGKNNADCTGCRSQWDDNEAPVGQFAENNFGLQDMVGNVWEWVEHPNYDGAPADGSAFKDCDDPRIRVARGGAFDNDPKLLRSATRLRVTTGGLDLDVGFRVARKLVAP
jgi:formylglycine-generating enzyme required for sulfatase activity